MDGGWPGKQPTHGPQNSARVRAVGTEPLELGMDGHQQTGLCF